MYAQGNKFVASTEFDFCEQPGISQPSQSCMQQRVYIFI
jgi:hypothetical protein